MTLTEVDGNITSIYDGKLLNTQTFTYDALNRLTSAVAIGGTSTYALENTTYNTTTGNLASKAGVNYGYLDTTHAHAVTHLNNVQKYWYDANGNQTRRIVGSYTYDLTYDAENRLIEVKRNGASFATFVYNGDGERIKSTVNGATTAFIGNIFEWSGSTSTMKKYYYAGSQRVAVRTGSTLSYILGDHLGSASVTTDANGIQVSEMLYKPWGEVRYTSGTLPTKYTYTGQYSDVADFGLMYYNARWVDPVLGRFAQADTLIPEPGNPQSWDRYSYVNNSPLVYTDPSGHQAWDGCSGENGGCAGGSNYKDYVFNYLHTDQERQENQEDLEKAVDTVTTVIGVVNEPVDWMMTAAYCASGECSPWVLVGLLPFVPSSVGRKADTIVDVVKGLDGAKLPVDDVLDLATEFLVVSHRE